MMLAKRHRGFTLVELIIVIAILAGLALLVFVAINPLKRINDARQAEVESNAEQMTKAINLQIVDTFAIPAVPDPAVRDICQEGWDDPVGTVNPCINLDQLIEEGYLSEIPVTQEFISDTRVSGYEIAREGGTVRVCPRGRCFVSGGGGNPAVSSSSAQSSIPSIYTVVPTGNKVTTEGTTLSITDIGQFFDPEISGDEAPYSFAINWGDGMPEDTGTATIDVNGSPGVPTQGSFDGAHTYADNGNYTVTLTVTSSDSRVIGDEFTVNVNNVAPTLIGSSNQTIGVGQNLSLAPIAQFSDPGFNNALNIGGETQEIFTYAINWGDGSALDSGPPTITVQGGPGVAKQGTFNGSHTYGTPGVYTVTVTISDDDGSSDNETFQVGVIGPMGSNLFFPQDARALVPVTQLHNMYGGAPFSVAFWVKPSTALSAILLNYYQSTSPTGSFYINLSNDSKNIDIVTNFVGTFVLQDSVEVFSGTPAWHHVVFTFGGVWNDQAGYKLFVDGVDAGLLVSSAPLGEVGGPPAGVGGGLSRFMLGGYGIPGNLDDVRIYDRDLSATPSDIAALTDLNATNDPSSGLMHLWTLNENTGTTFSDSIGTSHGGFFSSAPPSWSADAPF